MRRLFWLTAGVGVGVVGVWRARRAVSRFTPTGLAENLVGVGEAVRDFVDEVREGMVERELELRSALGLENPQDILGAVMDADRESWQTR